jgi:hypothetical protein
MSYNVDDVSYLSGQLTIGRKVARVFMEEHERLPDINPLEYGDIDLSDSLPDDEQLPLAHPHWNGEGSGHGIEDFEALLSLTKGTADLLLVWEGGDTFTGYRVTDGKVEEKEVLIRLKD